MEPGSSGTSLATDTSPTNRLIKNLLEYATYKGALLFLNGQYLYYSLHHTELRAKAVSSQALRAAFVEEPVDTGWLPEGVVRWGGGPAGTFLVKFLPPGPLPIRLATPTEPLTITLALPALVFAGVGTTYYIWALPGPTCDPQAHLYHAPFPNVYPDGRICFGGNHRPDVSWQTFDEAWQLFLLSPFNGSMHENKSHAFPADVRRQLLALANTTATRYPVEDLTPFLKRPFGEAKDLRTLDDVVDHFFLKGHQL